MTYNNNIALTLESSLSIAPQKPRFRVAERLNTIVKRVSAVAPTRPILHESLKRTMKQAIPVVVIAGSVFGTVSEASQPARICYAPTPVLSPQFYPHGMLDDIKAPYGLTPVFGGALLKEHARDTGDNTLGYRITEMDEIPCP